MKYLGILMAVGGAYWFYNKNKTVTTTATPATQSFNEADLYKKQPYSVSMGIRG